MLKSLREVIQGICTPNSAWKPPVIDPVLAEEKSEWYVVRIVGAYQIFRDSAIDRDGPKEAAVPVVSIKRKSRAELDRILWPHLFPQEEQPEVTDEEFGKANDILSSEDVTPEDKELAAAVYWRYMMSDRMKLPHEIPGNPELDFEAYDMVYRGDEPTEEYLRRKRGR